MEFVAFLSTETGCSVRCWLVFPATSGTPAGSLLTGSQDAVTDEPTPIT